MIDMVREIVNEEKQTFDCIAEAIIVRGSDWDCVRICNKLADLGIITTFSFDNVNRYYTIPIFIGGDCL